MLVLGTMPGPLSLAKGEYYAHPRNAFWRIASDLFHFDPALPYPLRLRRLLEHGVGLWDVLHSCNREGAADVEIKDEVPNDFNSLLLQHPTIKYVFLNGSTADRLFTRHVLPQLPSGSLSLFRLPSTSPAHAAMGYEQKLLQWRAIAELKSFQGASR